MKVAFVDNLPVGGGLSRFSYLLCKHLVELKEDIHIDYYVHFENLQRTPELKTMHARVRIIMLQSTVPPSLYKRMVKRVTDKIEKQHLRNNRVKQEIESRVKNYDIAYFPSAHMMEKPDLDVPLVGTIHDFNWKYFFGRQIFSLPFLEMMDKEILRWMESPYTICSSQDVVDEARKLYPNARHYPNVVHIGPVVMNTDISSERSNEILKGLGIDYPYIIFPGNFYPHKNHLNLFTAFYLLKKRKGFENYKLILTGFNSEHVPKGIAEYRGVQLLTANSPQTEYNIRGMGYQSNEVLDLLIKNASLLVSPSIYEAICTPAMDAWNFGVPTAISDIPPFREHERIWGIRSAFFDPMNPLDIADTIERYLNNPEQAKADGLISQQRMNAYHWGLVAKGYMDIFQKAIA